MDTPLTVDDLQKDLQQFGIYDYLVFLLLLVLSALIGVYFAWASKKQKKLHNDEDEYLMGGRNMNFLPVGFSLIASWISGIFLLGIPTEIYMFGTECFFIGLSIITTGIVFAFVYLPVFHDLQVSSCYEYLEKRFDKKVRLLGSILFVFFIVFWMPIVIYVPALAFNQVTGINVHITTSISCLVCVFYTSIGGLKAVVWTDMLQSLAMFSAVLTVIVKGTMDIGGFSVVWQRCQDGQRIEFPSFSPDPTIRYSFWTLLIGGTFHWVQASAVNQNMLQRYLSLRTLKKAQMAAGFFVVGVLLLLCMVTYSGLLAYATYYDCDPFTTKLAKAKDQLIPLLMMRVLKDCPGMPGLFVAGVFSAALSSVSTGLNSMSAVILEDFCKPFFKNISDRMSYVIMRGSVVVLGVLFVLLVVLVEKLGTVVQLSNSFMAMTAGPSLGLFTCGILIPWVNSNGVFFGGLLGLLFSAFLNFGAQNAIAHGQLFYLTKPTSIDGCDYYFNLTGFDPPPTAFGDNGISYMLYAFAGTSVTIVLSVIISFFTNFNKLENVDRMLVSPLVRSKIPKTRSLILLEQEEELIGYLKKNNKDKTVVKTSSGVD